MGASWRPHVDDDDGNNNCCCYYWRKLEWTSTWRQNVHKWETPPLLFQEVVKISSGGRNQTSEFYWRFFGRLLATDLMLRFGLVNLCLLLLLLLLLVLIICYYYFIIVVIIININIFIFRSGTCRWRNMTNVNEPKIILWRSWTISNRVWLFRVFSSLSQSR